jgi:predicted AlkP superfamily phosphohydrolase/phosphomutase
MPSRLTPDMVDWPRTVAWGEGGYCGRLFLNVAKREPQGAVAPDDYERVLSELRERIESRGDEHGVRLELSPTDHKTYIPTRRRCRSGSDRVLR